MLVAHFPVSIVKTHIHQCPVKKATKRSENTKICSMKASSPDTSHPTKVVGMGSAGVDYLAQVAAYPEPDEKLRTERLEVQGGGNCGNALTAAARLGLSPTIITKIGDDAVGDGIISDFQKENIATDGILRATNAPSPFTYIIVDRQGGTRTCIHTPGEALTPNEMTPDFIKLALKDASLIYFDGRLTEAALVVAKEARKMKIPILVEAERLRPALDQLLLEADYVVTSAHFPESWTGEKDIGNAMAVTLHRLPRVKWMITTQGRRGSILFERRMLADITAMSIETGETRPEENPEEIIRELFRRIDEECTTSSARRVPACTSANGVDIYAGTVLSDDQPRMLVLPSRHQNKNSNHDSHDNEGTTNDDLLAKAQRAALANADSISNARNYMHVDNETVDGESSYLKDILITVASAAHIPSSSVLDTTGAGDAFIGSVLYCISKGISPRYALKLGGVVAACKCTALGARPGLPFIHTINNIEELVSH